MCIYAIAYQIHPDHPLLIAGNRDELLQRPTQAAHFWDDYPDIYAARDLQQGGTWLGVNKRGHFACLTNYRNLSHPLNNRHTEGLSRGQFAVQCLTQAEITQQSLQSLLLEQGNAMRSFNLITGDQSGQLFYLSNVDSVCEPLEPGIYVISNELGIMAQWSKSQFLKQSVTKLLAASSLDYNDIVMSMTMLLQDGQFCDDSLVPMDTGLTFADEKQRSALFVRANWQGQDYGTCFTTVLAIDAAMKHCQYTEIRYEEKMKPQTSFKEFQFN